MPSDPSGDKPRELSRWGVGPKITILALISAILAGVATRLWPEVCVVQAVPRTVAVVGGLVLLAIGLSIWGLAVPAVMRAYSEDRLETAGVFGLVRNPIYSAWIVFNFPGIALFCRSWPLLAPSLVGYVVFQQLIHRENDYLEKRFGEAYRTYKAEVNALIPFPRRKS